MPLSNLFWHPSMALMNLAQSYIFSAIAQSRKYFEQRTIIFSPIITKILGRQKI